LTLIRSRTVTAFTQVPDPVRYLSILISSRARSRRRASKRSFLFPTLQTRRSPPLVHRDGYVGLLRTMSSNVGVRVPLRSLDPRCAVPPTHRRRHISCFDWNRSPSDSLPLTPNRHVPKKTGRVTSLPTTIGLPVGHVVHTNFPHLPSSMYHYQNTKCHHPRLASLTTLPRLCFPPLVFPPFPLFTIK